MKPMGQNNWLSRFAGPSLNCHFPLTNALSRWQKINIRNRNMLSFFLASFISSIQPTKHFKIPVNLISECPNYSFQSTFVPGRKIKIKLALHALRRSHSCYTARVALDSSRLENCAMTIPVSVRLLPEATGTQGGQPGKDERANFTASLPKRFWVVSDQPTASLYWE